MSLETFVFFEKFRESLSNRDLERAAGFLKTPMPIFHPNGFRLVADQKDGFVILKSLFSRMNAAGVQKIFHSIDEVSKQPGGSNMSCLLTLHYTDKHEQQLCDSLLRFYLDRDDHGLKIVMVDYKKVAFNQIFESNPPVEALSP